MRIGVAGVGVNCTHGVMGVSSKFKSTSTESKDRCPQCLGLALSSTEAESTPIAAMRMRERAPSKKEMKGEKFCQGRNIWALTTRLGDAWTPLISQVYQKIMKSTPIPLKTEKIHLGRLDLFLPAQHYRQSWAAEV